MPTQVKICGLTRPEDVANARSAGADFLGFIVEAKSPRKLILADAKAFINNIVENTVAVTVDPDDRLVEGIQAAGFTHIQLHGSETVERTAEIASGGLIVIKAVQITTADDVTLAAGYCGTADLILFDAKPSQGEAQRGGHGQAFDWQILRSAPSPKQFILAGGLRPDNVRRAVALTNAPIVDVSSGVEVAPGIKDARLIRNFMEQLRE